MNNAHFIGAKFGLGGFNPDTNLAPIVVLEQDIYKNYSKTYIDECHDLYFMNKLSYEIIQCNKLNKFPIVIGGDHSIAIGTWRYMNIDSLIWIDAHEDSHTPSTSHTKRLHGMPLAVLLGFGKYYLTLNKQTLDPNKVTIIGVRSFETEEDKFLKSLGVKIIYEQDFKNLSLDEITNIALQRTKNSQYGISLDLDVIKNDECPGVQCNESGGISNTDLIKILSKLKTDRLKAFEIVEYNPKLDIENKSLNIINDAISTILV